MLLILALILVAGMGVFLFRLVRDGRQWVSFPANQAVYSDGVLTVGTLTDRNGTVLAGVSDGQRTYAAYESVRRGCLHVVGDESDNIGTGALTAFASRLIGYNLITGTYSLKGEGRSLALSVDADLSAAALEALEGYRGTVLVCNYKTGEILCNVSLPAYDPADPPEDFTDEAYEGVFINRGLSARYTPGSVFKIVTLAAAIDNIEDLFDRTFTCEGETLIGDDTVTCTGYHGEQTIEEAFANSCNCVFGQLALELGPEVLSRYAQRCGLTEPYFIDGRVERGRGVGHLLGIPTANIEIKDDKFLPKNGVYGTKTIVDGKTYVSVTNVGPKPTFGDGTISVETLIKGFDGDIYNESIRVIFIEYLRDIRKFDDPTTLRDRVLADLAWVEDQ